MASKEKLALRDYLKILFYTIVMIAMTALLYFNYWPGDRKVEDITNNIIKLIGYVTVNHIALECLWNKFDIIFGERIPKAN